MSLNMSRAEREEFLAGLHVGVLAVALADGAERLELARRYLGIAGGDAYIAANPGGSQVMIRMTPEHWLSRAYSDG